MHQLTSIRNLTDAALAACSLEVTGAINIGDNRPVALGAVLREVLDATGRADVELGFIRLPRR